MSYKKLSDLKYSEILQMKQEIYKSLTGQSYDIHVLSNITVAQINEILACALGLEGMRATVHQGDFDNIVQDSFKCQESRLVVIFMELCNLIDGLTYEIELMDEDEIEAIFQKTTASIDLIFKNLKGVPLVLFNRFTALAFVDPLQAGDNRLDMLATRLNHYVDAHKPDNVQCVDIAKIMAKIGVNPSVDRRYFYSSRVLYTMGFFKEYVQAICPYILSINGKTKKALICDCDGTLWAGVLGEDGPTGIDMSPESKTGAIYAEVQSILCSLNCQGVLIGLCSKNNPEDVEEIIATHPDMRLKDEHIAIKRVNWQDKVSNLKEIAAGLGIGLDSLVFIDDLDFEVNLIRQQLPEVTVLHVPKNLWEYPTMLREHLGLFYRSSVTKEDEVKTQLYKEQVLRDTAKAAFVSIDDYLASLSLRIEIKINDESLVPRLAQLTQKTNQFNLTTKRYTETDIKNYIECDDALVLSFSVSDKFGDSGVVGLGIILLSNAEPVAEIDTFLLSCRVIGRNIEFAVMDYIIDSLKERRIKYLKAQYIETPKNKQVMDFYPRCCFVRDTQRNNGSAYVLDLDTYVPNRFNYMEVIDGAKN